MHIISSGVSSWRWGSSGGVYVSYSMLIYNGRGGVKKWRIRLVARCWMIQDGRYFKREADVHLGRGCTYFPRRHAESKYQSWRGKKCLTQVERRIQCQQNTNSATILRKYLGENLMLEDLIFSYRNLHFIRKISDFFLPVLLWQNLYSLFKKLVPNCY